LHPFQTITSESSRKICHCKHVAHFDHAGKPVSLFPVDKDAKHLNVDGAGSIQCGMLKLGEGIALAKYRGLHTILGLKKPDDPRPMVSKVVPWKTKNDEQKTTSAKHSQIKHVRGTSSVNPVIRTATSSETIVATEAEADDDIPLLFRRYTEKYPLEMCTCPCALGRWLLKMALFSKYIHRFHSLLDVLGDKS